MQSQLVRVAVAAALASAASMAAHATAYTIHISGASAQRTFWEEDLNQLTSGTFAAPPTTACPAATFIKTTAGLNPPVPDLHSLTCTVQSTHGANLPSSINVGDTITLNYEAEFGSVWGIAPMISGSVAATTGRRSVTNATVVGYSRDKDTATSGLSAPTAIDIAVSDAEPIFWALPDNWPVSDGVTSNGPNGTGTNNVIDILSIPGQGQPTLAQLQALEATWVEVNGEVFSVVVNNTAAPTNTITNLSTQSLRSIFTGKYTNWSQVPEVGSGGAIVVCRRDHGSGTQVTSSLYFTQTECGGNNGANFQGNAAGAPPRFVSNPQSAAGSNEGVLSQSIAAFESLPFVNNPIENFSTNDITACLNAYPGVSIGIRALSPSSGYTTLNVDNVQANAHNAASGAYRYAITTWAFNNSATSQPGSAGAQAISAALISDAQRGTRLALPLEPGTLSGGVWTSSAPSVVFGLQDGALNPIPTFASNTANPSFPVQDWKETGKSSCVIPTNTSN
jgi:PBP superfamily domain